MNFMKKLKCNEKRRKEITIYLLFGIITTLVSWGSFLAMRIFIPTLNENIANIISVMLAVITSYITNRKYVFASSETNIVKEFLIFCSGRVVTILFETISFYIFVTIMGMHEMIMKVCISIIVVILNYIISKTFVFKDRKEK